ncbi:MAG: hypothetical protein GY750_20840 [Lentisphaerae bacterium]|nr:hypothetical protein [Lentisphaerota bacterium]
MSYVVFNQTDFTETGFNQFKHGTFNKEQLTENAKYLHQRHGRVYFDDGETINERRKLASELMQIK